MKAFGKSHSLACCPWSRCVESVTYGWHHILKSAWGMWKFCVWLAFSDKGQEACDKNLVLPGRCQPRSVMASWGGSWFIHILMAGEYAQCNWTLALERTGCPSPAKACSGTLVPKIHLLQVVWVFEVYKSWSLFCGCLLRNMRAMSTCWERQQRGAALFGHDLLICSFW